MKTGRVRKKAQPTESQAEKSPPAKPKAKPKKPKPRTRPRPTATSHRPPSGPSKPPGGPPKLIFGIFIAVFLCFALVMLFLTLHGGAKEWVRATRAEGAWTTTVTLLAPQVQSQEMWEEECRNTPNGAVRAGTCILKKGKAYQEQVVDDYDEYAYDIYYEETTDQVYQAQGANFVTTQLGGDDWWEGDKHYIRQEELDKGSCQYTNYTVWIDDPQDASQEIEVYLSECEVWDHVVVKERVYDQKRWCVCDVTTLAPLTSQSEQGTGLDIRWPEPSVPSGGRAERSFKGQVTFGGDDYVYTVTTDDLALYRDYLTGQYYIGIKDGKAVTVRKNPPK